MDIGSTVIYLLVILPSMQCLPQPTEEGGPCDATLYSRDLWTTCEV